MTAAVDSGPRPARANRFELALVVLLGAANVLFEALIGAKTAFVVVAVVIWGVYVVATVRRSPSLLADWGLRRDTVRPAALAVGLVTAVALAGTIAWGLATGAVPPPRSFWVILAIYPLWGLAQQFLFNAMLVRNLRAVMPEAPALLCASLLFAASHLPDLVLAALVLPAGVVWGWIYLRWPNLWVLALGHGIVGTAVVYLLLARDPLAALIASAT